MSALTPPTDMPTPTTDKITQAAMETIYLCKFRVSMDGEWLCLRELDDISLTPDPEPTHEGTVRSQLLALLSAASSLSQGREGQRGREAPLGFSCYLGLSFPASPAPPLSLPTGERISSLPPEVSSLHTLVFYYSSLSESPSKGTVEVI